MAAIMAVTVMSLPAQAAYQNATAASWVPNQPVYAIAVTAKRIYLGGEFTRLTNPDTGASIARSGLVALDRATGNPIKSWSADTDHAVRALVAGGDGRLYVGGDFTTIDGVARAGLAALGSGGTPVAGWAPTPNGRVWDLRVDGSSLYVAGNFGRIDTIARPGVARLDLASGALDYAFNAAVTGGRVQALEVSAGVVYLGGPSPASVARCATSPAP
ncbi:MAG: hypothetical protein R2731_19595 [Nocardioides sp.]